MSQPDLNQLYRTISLIRRFEETVLAEFSRGAFYGTTHTYIGEEANAAAVLGQIQTGDVVVSNHRCHGHFLAYGGDPQALFAELMGKPSGVCAGRGGSQHLHWKNFYSNGILGGTLPIATGMALAEKWQGTDALVVAFTGDGAMGQGVVYESLNYASLWGAPILFVLENNHIAQTTPFDKAVAGSLAGRFAAFGIPVTEMDSSDVVEIWPAAGACLQAVRTENRPHALILHTERFGPHSKGDDTRPAEELERMRLNRDPLSILADRLEPAARSEINEMVKAEITTAYKLALDAPSAERRTTPVSQGAAA